MGAQIKVHARNYLMLCLICVDGLFINLRLSGVFLNLLSKIGKYSFIASSISLKSTKILVLQEFNAPWLLPKSSARVSKPQMLHLQWIKPDKPGTDCASTATPSSPAKTRPNGLGLPGGKLGPSPSMQTRASTTLKWGLTTEYTLARQGAESWVCRGLRDAVTARCRSKRRER